MTGWLVRLTCAIALLFVGFAHETPVFAKSAFIIFEPAQYVLPDGTLPVICIEGKAQGNHTHDKVQAAKCEACRIGSSVLLPLPACGGGARPLLEADRPAPREPVGCHRRPWHNSRGARAPPAPSLLLGPLAS
jgi:hypothetical protein